MADNDSLGKASRIGRRRTIKALGAAGLAGLAGCSGGGGGGDGGDGGGDGGDGDDGDGGGGGTTTTSGDGGGGSRVELTYRSAPSGSVAFAMASQLGSIINQNSDMRLNVQTSTGATATSLLLQGEVDLAHSTALMGQQGMNGQGPFEGVEASATPMQVNSYYWIRVGLVAPTSSDLEYYTDLAGRPFNPANSGASFFTPFRMALLKELAEDQINTRNTDISQLSQHLASGRVEAAGGPLFINTIVPGYMQQVYSQNDVRLLGWPGETIPKIEDDPLIGSAMVTNEDLGAIAEFPSSPETFMVSSNYVTLSSEVVPEQPIYDMLNIFWDQKESLPDAHAAFGPWTDESFWLENFSTNLPVHPGAAKFYQEKGIWSDEYTVGSL